MAEEFGWGDDAHTKVVGKVSAFRQEMSLLSSLAVPRISQAKGKVLTKTKKLPGELDPLNLTAEELAQFRTAQGSAGHAAQMLKAMREEDVADVRCLPSKVEPGLRPRAEPIHTSSSSTTGRSSLAPPRSHPPGVSTPSM